jgi:hypothetical protein
MHETEPTDKPRRPWSVPVLTELDTEAGVSIGGDGLGVATAS